MRKSYDIGYTNGFSSACIPIWCIRLLHCEKGISQHALHYKQHLFWHSHSYAGYTATVLSLDNDHIQIKSSIEWLQKF